MTGAADHSVDCLAAMLLEDFDREQRIRALAFCRGCKSQFDSRVGGCARCAAYRQRRPYRHEESR